MTWIAACRTWNHGIVLFDSQVTSARGPITDFGIWKVQGVAANAVAGFAGSALIGLDILEMLGDAATERQRLLPSGVRFGVRLPSYAMEFINWLEPAYSRRYSKEAREQGLELLILAALHTDDPEVQGDVTASLTRGVKFVFPRPGSSERIKMSMMPLMDPMSIGSGAHIKEYESVLGRITGDHFDEHLRRLDDPEPYKEYEKLSSRRAFAMIPLLENVLQGYPVETVGQHLLCSMITPEGLFGPYSVGGWSKQGRLLNRASEVTAFLKGDMQAAAQMLG